MLRSSLSVLVLLSGMVPHEASDRSRRAISPSKGIYKERGAKGATLGQALSISMVAHDACLDGRVSQRESRLRIAQVSEEVPPTRWGHASYLVLVQK